MRISSTLVPGVASALLLLWPSGAEAANLLKNPGFETGDFTSWVGDGNGAVTSVPGFLPETILSGNHGARIFPNPATQDPIFIYQQFTIPTEADRLRFGGNLRFFSFEPFDGNLDMGAIWLFINPQISITLGTQPDGLPSTQLLNQNNQIVQVSDWLFFEQLVNVSGLGGQTAFFILMFQDFGIPQDTAVAFDDLFVEVVPVPSPALLPGLVGLGIAVYRRKMGNRSA